MYVIIDRVENRRVNVAIDGEENPTANKFHKGYYMTQVSLCKTYSLNMIRVLVADLPLRPVANIIFFHLRPSLGILQDGRRVKSGRVSLVNI